MKSMRHALTVATLIMTTAVATVNISNVVPRRDVKGELMDVHDGNIIKIDGLWHWYGMGYLNCTEKDGLIPPFQCSGIYDAFGRCGFRADHAVRLYTSPDLASWTLISDNVLPLQSRPFGIYFRPKVIFNALSQKFVLWINYLPNASTPLKAYPNATYIVGTSSSPDGPFCVVNYKANVQVSGGGDFTLLDVPSSNSAFIAYDAWGNNHKVLVEQLNPDFTDSLGGRASTPPISNSGNEAPILFERRGYYYLLFGPVCCFCKGGSGSEVYTSKHPLGPYTSMGIDINPKNGFLGKEGRTIKAQENYVISVSNDTFIYTGDRWSSAPDKLKSHDFQYWYPLQFDDSKTPPTIAPMKFVTSFQIDAERPRAQATKLII